MKASWTFLTLIVLASAPAAQAVDRPASGFREVSFETADGARIYANLYGGGDHAVVLAHGAVFNKESWDALARELAAGGLRVLAIDFRGYGKSTDGRKSGALHLDVLGAVAYLKAAGATRVSLAGGSMGGGAVGDAAAMSKPGDIDRLVLLAAAPVEKPEQLIGRKLFIVSEGDGVADSVRDQFRRAKEPKKLVVLPGDAHAQHIFRTSQSRALTSAIIDWLHETSQGLLPLISP